jgi:hypothetical protein
MANNTERQSLACSNCHYVSLHEISFVEAEDAHQRRCLYCLVVHNEPVIHWLYSFNSTACALDIGGATENGFQQRRFAQKQGDVTCPECATMMMEELHEGAEPDWRPSESIAEDFYAF